jgi:hypothetical protein
MSKTVHKVGRIARKKTITHLKTMIIKRKGFSGYGEVTINGVRYVPAQVMTDTLHDTMNTAENVVSKVDQTAIGQTMPVKKKTRMVKNVISGLKGFMPARKKKKGKDNVY